MAKETAVRKRGMKKILAAFPGSRPVKYHGNKFSENGVADTLISVAPFGLYVAIEWKRDAKEEPNTLQEKFLYDINQSGGLGICTHDASEAIRKIKAHQKKIMARIIAHQAKKVSARSRKPRRKV